MKKILLALVVCAFSLSALACDGGGKKDKEKDKNFTPVTQSF